MPNTLTHSSPVSLARLTLSRTRLAGLVHSPPSRAHLASLSRSRTRLAHLVASLVSLARLPRALALALLSLTLLASLARSQGRSISRPVVQSARLAEIVSMVLWFCVELVVMDRTSILGDTIDYMKELLSRIKNLQEEMNVNSDELNLMGIFKELKTNEIMIRNTPKILCISTIH
ncbi:hypothetical protein Syun_026418 [Stephania yunnanensis]|uniref:Uncharacterized protein n=1 Tax=Stephania yunnanensis TaxID=152371 RepID=A0AAP0HS56_9MAGN